MSRSVPFVTSALILAISLSAACGGSDSSGPSTPVDISGGWNIFGSISNSTLQVSCNAGGTMVLSQTGGQFSGYGTNTTTCSGPGGSSTDQDATSYSGGKVSGNQVSFFDDGGCKFTGAATGDPANAMSGNVSCTMALNGTFYKFTGPWNASR